MALLALYLAAFDTSDGGVPQVLLLYLSQGSAVTIVDNPRAPTRAMNLSQLLQTLKDRDRSRVVPAENDLSICELDAFGDETRAANPRDILDPI